MKHYQRSVNTSSQYQESVQRNILKKYTKKRLTDPVELLRYLQESLVHCRPLHLTNDTSKIKRLRNCITVSRSNIFDKTYQELPYIDHYVTFMKHYVTLHRLLYNI